MQILHEICKSNSWNVPRITSLQGKHCHRMLGDYIFCTAKIYAFWTSRFYIWKSVTIYAHLWLKLHQIQQQHHDESNQNL